MTAAARTPAEPLLLILACSAPLLSCSALQSGPQGTAFQSHTYAGSSARALANGASLLDALPSWRPSVRAIGDVRSKLT